MHACGNMHAHVRELTWPDAMPQPVSYLYATSMLHSVIRCKKPVSVAVTCVGSVRMGVKTSQ